MENKFKYLIGIDEAGRGPLAGPVSVGLVIVPTDFDWGRIPGVGDSKQISEKKREIIFERAKVLQKEGRLTYVVELVSAKKIDDEGISSCIKKAIAQGLEKLSNKQSQCKSALVTDKSSRRDLELKKKLLNRVDMENKSSRSRLELGEVMVKLDGSLSAPPEYLNQETIIKGDSKERVIGLASIMAKVTRDRYMCKVGVLSDYAVYNFAQHKGYGTLAHRRLIAQKGLSAEHRASYCKNIKMMYNSTFRLKRQDGIGNRGKV